ncbi:hypothetical protein R1flu_014127 [Riccia fluitans]|uniref:Uncharacterized protein n=1 Tax=Riccia fluitans TaxID=41844 RepID=A0ABD1YF79_9MARC
MTDEEVFDALRSARWEFKSKDIGDGGQSLAEELSCYKEKKSVKPEDPKIHNFESSLFKEEEKEIQSERSTREETRRMKDVTNKLSDGASEIVTMVIVGCDTKDELALAVSKFIAHVNKQDGSRRPFTGHKGFTVLEKCRMIVDYALASEKVSLIGRGRMKHHKIVLDRTNVHST